MDTIAKEIIAIEKAALVRWGHGDPAGFLEITAEDVVYFDPYVASRIDGLEEISRRIINLSGARLFSTGLSCSIRPCRYQVIWRFDFQLYILQWRRIRPLELHRSVPTHDWEVENRPDPLVLYRSIQE